jgi:hypothetical protein
MILHAVNDYYTLLSRNFKVLWADLLGLTLTLFLPPIITALLWIAFTHLCNDTKETDNQVLSAQLIFDTVTICKDEMDETGNGNGKILTYDDRITNEVYKDTRKTAMEQFQDDYCLYNYLYNEVADKGSKDIGVFYRDAKEIWENPDCDKIPHNSFILHFPLFRYNLPAMLDEKPPYEWPEDTRYFQKNEAFLRKILDERIKAVQTLHQNISGEESTRSHMTVFFILIAAAIWMGLLPACKEIVSEWNVFLRESRNNVSTFSFLLAKFTMLAIVTALQNILFVVLAGIIWQKFPLSHCLAIYIILTLTSTCAAALGLMISSITTNIRQGLMIIPMIMVAQLILGGLLRLPAQTRDEEMKHARIFAGKATLQYWAFEAMTGFIARLPEAKDDCPIDSKTLLRREIVAIKKPDSAVKNNRETLETYLESKVMRVDDYIFGEGKPGRFLEKLKNKQDKWRICETEEDWQSFLYHVIRPLSYIFLANVALLLLTILLLKVKLAITRNGGLMAMIFRI